MYGYIKTPVEVFRIGVGIRACARSAYEISVLNLLLHHPRMSAVWKQFMAKKQGMPGVYLHPAVGGAVSADGPAQQRACGKVLSVAFYAICNPVQISKWDETKEYREKILAGPQNVVGLQTSSPPTASWTPRRMAAPLLFAPSPG